ncbi:MAG: ABC transporter substrate-binding protein [Deltaproteobacteria bacterium]|nr:ABC transporter substrate-binding protein [Deltaproteobacteria bacterium]
MSPIKKYGGRVLCLALLFSASLEAATPPLQVAKQFFNELVAVSQITNPTEKQQRVAGLIGNHFYYEPFYQKALVDYWSQWTPRQKEQFHHVFQKRFVENITNKSKRLGSFQDAKVKYILETNSKDLAVVVADGKLKKDRMKVRLFLVRQGKEWKVFDLEIAGALLSRNYRGRFNFILKNEGFEILLAKLKSP